MRDTDEGDEGGKVAGVNDDAIEDCSMPMQSFPPSCAVQTPVYVASIVCVWSVCVATQRLARTNKSTHTVARRSPRG